MGEVNFGSSHVFSCLVRIWVSASVSYCGQSQRSHRLFWGNFWNFFVDLEGRHVVINETICLESSKVIITLAERTSGPTFKVVLVGHQLAVFAPYFKGGSVIINTSGSDQGIHIMISFSKNSRPTLEIMLIHNNNASVLSVLWVNKFCFSS